jgi:tripeptidyl-peptidase I
LTYLCIGSQSSNGTIFNPSFPGTCPYITSVGATQISPNASVFAPETATYGTIIALPSNIIDTQSPLCTEVIYSGGGFSNNFAMPSYQKSAVQSYLKNYPPPYPASKYNSTGTSRGYPDISANGANYVVAVDGTFQRVFGTSAVRL